MSRDKEDSFAFQDNQLSKMALSYHHKFKLNEVIGFLLLVHNYIVQSNVEAEVVDWKKREFWSGFVNGTVVDGV